MRRFAAALSLTFVTATLSVNSSSARTTEGATKESLNFAFWTRTPPFAFPLIRTAPTGRPRSSARMSNEMRWKPSLSPRIVKSAMPCSAGLSVPYVVRGAGRAVGPDLGDRERLGVGRGLAVAHEVGQRQRVVVEAGLGLLRVRAVVGVAAPHAVGAERQVDGAGDVPHDEARSHRRAVRDEELGREELLQEPDVAGDDEEGGDAEAAGAAGQL